MVKSDDKTADIVDEIGQYLANYKTTPSSWLLCIVVFNIADCATSQETSQPLPLPHC